ncbi:hypothetical protein EDF56_105202 [Novosphingobium sp. PhB165]|uniref:hypothetical protein n=1 Tax=Novosphingobium sp. PhB165 TaxID=2485105 RepID=UPI0010468754|nr:hypothetical protein [Novosphingobium sp. PhB165]TCM17858.1 hypothetical protein EDF56_105202 [Novosphingobium sp. PhB165]
MNVKLRNLGLGAALAASALTASAPAMAQDYGRGNDAAIAVGAGILGLAIGAAIADHGDRYYYDRRYYGARRYVTVRDRPGYYYYYEGAPGRYYQDRYYDRYYAPYWRGAHGPSWRNDARYGRYDDRRGYYQRYDNHRGNAWGRDRHDNRGHDDHRGHDDRRGYWHR